ncbi:MAG: HupE/UreJ family protein, partial [Rhodobacteraceae bacterium]|nr:HupE/UreJ family protein [Paracoccaceae bacterium]
MRIPSLSCSKVILATVLSSIITILSLAPQRLAAHEIVPAIADMTQVGDRLAFSVTLNIEAILAGIDLSSVTDTNTAPEAASYDELRALEPEALTEMTIEDWPAIASQIQIEVDGVSVVPVLGDVVAGPVGDIEVIRTTDLTFTVPLPNWAQNVTFGWAPALGTIVLRQQG